jgi:hypothetical protein
MQAVWLTADGAFCNFFAPMTEDLKGARLPRGAAQAGFPGSGGVAA